MVYLEYFKFFWKLNVMILFDLYIMVLKILKTNLPYKLTVTCQMAIVL